MKKLKKLKTKKLKVHPVEEVANDNSVRPVLILAFMVTVFVAFIIIWSAFTPN